MLLRHLCNLLSVAGHRNFTRAAEALHVSQPHAVAADSVASGSVGGAVVEPRGRAVRSTGRRAIHDVQNLNLGSFRIAMTPTFTTFLIWSARRLLCHR